MHKIFRAPILLLMIVMLGLVGFGLLIEPTNAQPPRPNRTPSAPVERPTLQAPQVTPPVVPTLGDQNNLSATVQAVSTLLAAQAVDARATAAAVLTAIPTLPAEFDSQALMAWLESFSEGLNIAYDPDTHMLTVEATVSETTLNTVIAEAFAIVGYEAAAVAVDLVEGAIVIVAEDVTLNDQLSGTLVVTAAVTTVNGEIVVSITGASLNGQALPPAIIADLNAALQAAFDVLVPPEELDYTVEAVTITDGALMLSVSLEIPVA